MRILLAYNTDSWNPNDYFFEDYLPGYQVEVLPIQKTGSWTNLRGLMPCYLQKRLPQYKVVGDYDLYIEIDGEGLYHPSLSKLKCKKVLWSLDNYRPDKAKFHKQIRSDFDTVYTAHRNYPGIWLPFGYASKVYKEYSSQRPYRLVHLGNTKGAYYQRRRDILNYLGDAVETRKNCMGKCAAMFYSQSQIVLNCSAAGEINLRVLEAMAAGALLLTDHIPDLKHLFDDVYATYTNKMDISNVLEYYLNHEEERKKLADLGCWAVQKHSLYNRFQTILEGLDARILQPGVRDKKS